MFSCSRNALVTFVKKTQKKIFISNSYFIRQIDFKGAGVNQALPCFYGGSLTVPLNLHCLWPEIDQF